LQRSATGLVAQEREESDAAGTQDAIRLLERLVTRGVVIEQTQKLLKIDNLVERRGSVVEIRGIADVETNGVVRVAAAAFVNVVGDEVVAVQVHESEPLHLEEDPSRPRAGFQRPLGLVEIRRNDEILVRIERCSAHPQIELSRAVYVPVAAEWGHGAWFAAHSLRHRT
jgi:hypothetical protein